MFKSDEVANFIVSFWGCIYAAVIPVAIHPPVTKDVRKSCDSHGTTVCMFLHVHAYHIIIT